LATTDATVVVAVSGGADSVALLLALDELVKSGKLNLSLWVAHLNHKLRLTSAADARWVVRLARQLGHKSSVGNVEVETLAKATGDNLEQAARRARYEFLAKTANRNRAEIVLTAHTMDDQAETVLLNLLRGSGLDGLGGIEPVRALDEGSEVLLARPLLSWTRRRAAATYCQSLGIEIRADEMNKDERFARVRVRTQLLPLMQSFNPKLVEALARTAELLREDNRALDLAAGRLLEISRATKEGARAVGKDCPPLRTDVLALAHSSLRRRALRQWLRNCRGDLRRIERVHVSAVETLLFGDRGGRIVELPGGAKVSRRRGLLHFIA
jgi:tRNA(Ile)-lysidine synthase